MNYKYVPYKTLDEKREAVKTCLEAAGSICRKVAFEKDKYPPKIPGEKRFYTMLISESISYLTYVESEYELSINSIQITYANGITATVSIRYLETCIKYFYDQDDFNNSTDHENILNLKISNNPKCKRYDLVELLNYIDSRITEYGGIYEIVFYICVWGRVNPDKAFPIKIKSLKDITFLYSQKNDKN
jgi:hypothetical protein